MRFSFSHRNNPPRSVLASDPSGIRTRVNRGKIKGRDCYEPRPLLMVEGANLRYLTRPARGLPSLRETLRVVSQPRPSSGTTKCMSFLLALAKTFSISGEPCGGSNVTMSLTGMPTSRKKRS